MPKTMEIRYTVVRRLPIFKRKCVVCGRAFDGPRYATFCSRKCQNHADYAKHAEERRRSKRESRRKAKSEAKG